MKIFKHAKVLTMAVLALAFACIAFVSVKASAADTAIPSYDKETDTITVTSSADTVYAAYFKTDEDAVAKKYYSFTVSGGSVTINLDQTGNNKGIKIAANKDAFLYISDVEPGDEAVSVNYRIAATAVKKINSVSFNYALAYDGEESTVLTVKYTNTTDTSTVNTVDLSKVYYQDIVNKAVNTEGTGDTLTGAILYNMCNARTDAGKAIKHKLAVQILGSESSVTVDGTNYNAQRTSKVKSVSVSAAATLKTVKVDYLKGTIAVKNGYDYAVVASGSSLTMSDLKTVLPKNKNATVTTYEKATSDFTPLKWSDDLTDTEKANFTSTAVKTLYLGNICSSFFTEGNAVDIYVRKSATVKKPASSFTTTKISLNAPADAPNLATTGGAIIIAAYDSDKETFTLPASSISGQNGSAGYEYLVVKATDLNAGTIDFGASKWTALKTAKAIKTTSIKSTIVYNNGDDKEKVAATDSGTLILIRGKGIKNSTLPTYYVKTQLVISGTTGVWQIAE